MAEWCNPLNTQST